LLRKRLNCTGLQAGTSKYRLQSRSRTKVVRYKADSKDWCITCEVFALGLLSEEVVRVAWPTSEYSKP